MRTRKSRSFESAGYSYTVYRLTVLLLQLASRIGTLI